MLTHNKLIQNLTDDNWDRRKRNGVARQFALGRSDGGDDVIRHTYDIPTQGVVGRYDRLRAQLLKIVAEAGGCAAHIRSESYKYQGRRLHYDVVLFGYRSDVERTISLYEGLIAVALVELAAIQGDGVATRRRQWFTNYMSMLSARLADVGKAPSMTWVSEHHDVAYAALENSPARWHREMA